MKIDEAVLALVNYAEKAGLIENEDKIYSVNRIIEALGLDGIEECSAPENTDLEEIFVRTRLFSVTFSIQKLWVF